MRRAAALAIGLAAIVPSDRPAAAAGWERCAGGKVDACTAIIRSRKMSDEDRAAAHYNRGNAYLAQSQHDLAIGDYDAAIRLKASTMSRRSTPRHRLLRRAPVRSGYRGLR